MLNTYLKRAFFKHNGAMEMEAETIKNAAGPKSHTNRINFLKSVTGADVKLLGVFACLLLVVASVLIFNACKKDIKTQDNSNMPVSKCISGEISFIENPYPIE